MLSLLSLKDFVIVPELTIEADKGLTCLTGETGAGKSILIDALQLVLGARSDTGVIREGAQRTEVAAEFVLTQRARLWLEHNDIESGHSVLMRRTVDTNGRSRCWINGSSVTVTQMRELAERLVDIHGQHAHQSLLKPAYQLQLVDGFGNHRPLLLEVKKAWDVWQKALARLTEATQHQEQLQAESERLSWMQEVLDELAPQESEWKRLSEEHDRLSHSADIVNNVRSAMEHLSTGDNNASRLVTLAQIALTHAGKYDSAYENYAHALSDAASLIDDTARDIAHYMDRLDLDDDRLAEIEDRLNAYWKISRKFHRAPEDIHALWIETRERLNEIEASADIDGLRLLETDARKAFLAQAARLSEARKEAARKLSDAVTREMQSLSMLGGRLEITLPESAPWAGGVERCEFLVSGHAGATPRALTKVASGGELARISLAISVITAQITPVPTLIFDEVDTGIGGAVAEVVGRLLRRLGESRQVLCVTHLPQVAACANQQWLVEKQTEDGVTTSRLRALSEAERIDEIARMSGGLVVSDATRQAANEMIQAAKNAG